MISYINDGIKASSSTEHETIKPNLITNISNSVCSIDIKDDINNNLLRNYYNIHIKKAIVDACFFIKLSIIISVCIFLYVMLVVRLILTFDKK